MVEDFYCPKAGQKNDYGFNFSRKRCVERFIVARTMPMDERIQCGCYDRYTNRPCKIGRQNYEMSRL